RRHPRGDPLNDASGHPPSRRRAAQREQSKGRARLPRLPEAAGFDEAPRRLRLCDQTRLMDWTAIALSVRLATIVALILLVIGLPIAYWLTFSKWRAKFLVEAVVALPVVLPPTVLGLYVLIAIGSQSPIGRAWTAWTGHGLAFTFEGLVIAS